MRNLPVRFLEGGMVATPSCYSTTSDYMSKLDQVVQEANAAGLFVVFDLHDTVQSGSPYGTAATLPKTEDIPFWKAIASHYKDNPMVMFDVFNEPKYQN